MQIRSDALFIGAVLLAFVALAGDALAAAAPASSQILARDAHRIAPKAYSIGGALALRDDVAYSFQTTSGPVRLDIGRITNETATTTSGTVRTGLFVTTTPTPTGGYAVIAQSDLGSLGPNQFFGPFSQTVSYQPPPDGVYYLHMGVFEFEGGFCGTPDGFCLDDYVSFADRVQVVNGQIVAAGPQPAPVATVVEYYHTGFNHYFITSFPDEIALLDAGRFQGWLRTGRGFLVWSANDGTMNGVCRFFSTSFAPKSSHFYTPFSEECATVRSNPNWLFEAIAFYVDLPNFNGGCATGTQPLYRLYNNGQSGAPNHRYTTSLDARAEMVLQGWTPEGQGPFGVIACVPI